MSTEKKASPDAVPADLLKTLQTALAHQREGRMKEAEVHYKQALNDFCFIPDAHYMAALFYIQNGKRKYGLTLLRKILQKNPDDVKALRLIGQARHEDGDNAQAILHLRRAVALLPQDAEINRLLGLVLYWDTHISEARGYLEQSLKLHPHIETYNKLAEIYLIEERYEQACALLKDAYANRLYNYDTLLRLASAHGLGSIACTRAALRAMRLDPSRDEAKTFLAQSIVLGGLPEEIGPALAGAVMLCLKSTRVNHNEIVTLWERQFFKDPQNARAVELYNQPDFEAFLRLYDQPEYRANLLQKMFVEGVKKIMVVLPAQEDLLTRLRRYYLQVLLQDKRNLSEQEENLLGALAIQCFYNEFVLDVSPEEQQQIQALKDALEAIPLAQADPQKIALFACYEPLMYLHNHKELIKAPMSPSLREVIDVSVAEVLEQRRIQKSIKSLHEIKDETSRKVQEQYEENPYPRWKSHSFVLPLAEGSFDPMHKRKFKILIAGCGTGKHILHTCATTPGAQITAIDLSRASLSYAMMRVKEFATPDLRFYNCDILDLDALENDFDAVECMGVLHHMREPLKGLEVLLRRLKRGGRISLGLYSEKARQDVVRMRDIIAQKNFPSTPEGIRACRRYIKETGNDAFQSLKISKDFYTISSCRDMLFHVQEWRYTLPQIQKILDDHGLVFQKFNLPRAKLDIYRKHFPHDPKARDLHSMDKFEQMHPALFAGMYQFSAMKK